MRIGAFGDSHTYGEEVDEQSDYPALLAELLRADGVARVEVLNFGSSWHGFHQAYILWDEVASQYDLDIILLGPATFWSDHATRFNHTNGILPYYLHARLIADGDDVRLIDVIGETHRERFDAYHALLPPWRYLRYDRNEPTFLTALLPAGRTLGNPFYYDDRPEPAEAIAIDRVLLRRMIRAGKPIVVGSYPWPGLLELAEAIRDLEAPTFCPVQLPDPDGFPYLAPRGQESPARHALNARLYAAALRGRPFVASLVRTGDPFGAAPDATAIDLDGVEDLRIVLGAQEIGRLVEPTTREVVDAQAVLGGRTRSLLILERPDRAPTDGVLLALPVALADSVRVVVPLTAGIALPSGVLGRGAGLLPIRPLPGATAIAVLDLPGLALDHPPQASVDAAALEALIGAPLTGEVELRLGERAVLRGRRAGERIELEPVDARMFWLRAAGNRDVADLPSEGSGLIELELRRGEQRTRVPLARWWTEPVTLDPAAACPTWVPPLR